MLAFRDDHEENATEADPTSANGDPSGHSSRIEQLRARARTLCLGIDEAERSHVELAALLHEAKAGAYAQAYGFADFAHWVGNELGFGLRKAQVLINMHGTYVIHLGIEPSRLAGLPWSKLAALVGIVNESNVEEILDEAASLSLREIRRKRLRPDEDRRHKPAVVAGSATEWRKSIPANLDMVVKPEIVEQLNWAIAKGVPMLLAGPSGCGKSLLAAVMADLFGRPLERFAFGAMSEPRTALIGQLGLTSEGTHFSRSRFVKAITSPGSIILADELNRANRDAHNLLLTLLDDQGYLALDEQDGGTVVHRHPTVAFIGTMNLGPEYRSADQAIDKALKDRFPVFIELDFPDPDEEAALLLRRCPGLPQAEAKLLVHLAAEQRRLAIEGDFSERISTRALIHCGNQIASGIVRTRAITHCLFNHFSGHGGDCSERAKLGQILQRLSA